MAICIRSYERPKCSLFGREPICQPCHRSPATSLRSLVKCTMSIRIHQIEICARIEEPGQRLGRTSSLRAPKHRIAAEAVGSMNVTANLMQELHNVQVSLPRCPTKSSCSVRCCRINVDIAITYKVRHYIQMPIPRRPKCMATRFGMWRLGNIHSTNSRRNIYTCNDCFRRSQRRLISYQ